MKTRKLAAIEPVYSWVTDELPDSDTTVLIHLADPEHPVWLGYHDGHAWRGYPDEPLSAGTRVLGWMHMDRAAVLLGPRCALCDRFPARGGSGEGSALCEGCYDGE